MSTTTQIQRLPATFTSLYRLFLRTCSASVLHQPRSTRNLRILWRPVFDAGAQVTRELQREGTQIDDKSRMEKERWLHNWNTRMDGTLELLYNSGHSRGLAHRLTRNLSKLVLGEKRRLWKAEYKYKVWNPSSPPAAQSKNKKREAESAWPFGGAGMAALTEIVQMAEARDGLSLGRVALKRRARKV